MQVREKDNKISVQSLERWLCDLQIKLLFSPTDKTEPLMKAKLGRFPLAWCRFDHLLCLSFISQNLIPVLFI